jgi:hypothetical protein
MLTILFAVLEQIFIITDTHKVKSTHTHTPHNIVADQTEMKKIS